MPALNTAPSARPFCKFHPEGVTCAYCYPLPSCTGKSRGSRSVAHLLKEAQIAQKAFWQAMARLESATGLELDWETADMSTHTVASLREEFPAKG